MISIVFILIIITLSLVLVNLLCSYNKLNNYFSTYIKELKVLINVISSNKIINTDLIQNSLDKISSSGLKLSGVLIKFLLPFIFNYIAIRLLNYNLDKIYLLFLCSLPYCILFFKKNK